MTQEDIIRMAWEAGGTAFNRTVVLTYEEARRFMAFAAAAERTQYEHTLALQQASYEREIKIEVAAERAACADICDQHASIEGIAQRCADAIRARNNP
jgi:hypothetical protein